MKKKYNYERECDTYQVDNNSEDILNIFDYLRTTMDAVDFDPCAAP